MGLSTPTVATMATESTSLIWLRASPKGTRSGFAVLPDGGNGMVTVTVLPKPWPALSQAVREYEHVLGETTHLVLHETEFAAIKTTPAAAGALAASLIEATRDQADLLSLDAPPVGSPTAPAFVGDPFPALLDLMLLTERGVLAKSPDSFEGSFSPSLLRLITQERLISRLETLVFRVRPRYSERTEMLTTPRGRLSERSLLYSQVTGTPRVECTFDELTTDTPIIRVVVSALRVICSERLPKEIAALRPGLQSRALHLMRLLSGVTLIEREQAILIAEGLWFGPLDQVWKPAIDAALPVLRNWAVNPEVGNETTDAVLVQVATEKFWEECLATALQRVFKTVAISRENKAGPGVHVPAPWLPPALGEDKSPDSTFNSFPDYMLRHGGKVVIADAKYKLFAGKIPGSADAYQLFAYSHLANLDSSRSDSAVLFYPTRSGVRPSQTKLERLRGRDYPLWLVRLPFPGPRDLKDRVSWDAYVDELARQLRDFADEWSAD